MDRIDHLRIFMRIADLGSFSQAADQLGLPRATVSSAIRQLEARLGTRLFHRTTRRVSLTVDGEALQNRACALVNDMDDLERCFKPTDEAITGRLRVDVPSRIARRLVAPALPDFFRNHPGVSLELGSTDRLIDLIQEGVDCALRVGPIIQDNLIAQPLGRFEMVNCASPGYLAGHGLPSSPGDLAKHVAVGFIASVSKHPEPWEWLEGGERRSIAVPCKVAVNNAESYIACARAGLGLIQVPRFDVYEHLRTGELVEVMPHARPAPLPVQVVYPHRQHLSRRLQAFISWVRELLGPYLLTA